MSNNKKCTPGNRFHMVPLYKEVRDPQFGKLLTVTKSFGKHEINPILTTMRKTDHIHSPREKEIRKELKRGLLMNRYGLTKELQQLTTLARYRK